MSSEGAAPDPEDTLVQYIVVRSDLGKDKGWPLGSVIAQGAHAATKTLWELRDSENVKEYCGNVDSMHKVVLGAKSEKQLSNSAEKLDEAGEHHRRSFLSKNSQKHKHQKPVLCNGSQKLLSPVVDETSRGRTMVLAESPLKAFLIPANLRTSSLPQEARSRSRKSPRPQPL
jgi:peptidyl-tRNA hydrolase